MKIDLHVHSVCSDGSATAEELIKFAVAANIETISICDGDNLKCVDEAKAAAAKYQIRYIPGIMIGGWYSPLNMNVHFLGYFVDEKNEKLQKLIDVMWEEAKENVKRKIDVLNRENIDIDMPSLKRFVLKKYPNYPMKQVGSKVVREFVEDKLNIGISIGEYIAKVLRKYNVELIEYHEYEEVIDVLKDAGAKIVLAHPGYYMFRNIKTVKDIEAMIMELKDDGVMGIEAYSPLNPSYYRNHFANFARDKGLVVTCGSDFQGKELKDSTIGSMECPEWVHDMLVNHFFKY